MNTNSNLYTFIYAAVLVIIVASGLAFAAVQLKPLQDQNVRIEKMSNILSSANIESNASNAEKVFKKHITNSYVVNIKGEKIEGIAAFTVNMVKVGKAIAKMFANQGAQTVIVDLDEIAAQQLALEIMDNGGQATALKTDITKEKDLDQLFQEVMQKYGTLDILINNAGGGLSTGFFEIDSDEWNRIISINLTAIFRISQRAAKIFRKKPKKTEAF